MGLATLKSADRWAGLRARTTSETVAAAIAAAAAGDNSSGTAVAVGKIKLKPVMCSGAQLVIGADLGSSSLRAGVANSERSPTHLNLSLANSLELRGSNTDLDQQVRFQGGQNFAALKGTLVELELLISGDAMAFSIGWRD